MNRKNNATEKIFILSADLIVCSLCHLSVCVADLDQGLFHPSWLLCVYQRMFHSENKSLMREGVCHLLELQVLQQPHFALAFSQVQVHTHLI